jgi:LacI family transcriptional regulator
MVDAGLAEPESGWNLDGLRSAEEAYAAVLGLLDRPSPPTALFTSQNVITIGAIRALHHLGRQHEVALIGFDDLILADALDPGVTVMAQDPNRMGTLAAERLFARLDGDRSPAETYVVPGRLVVRGSGEIPPPG